MSKSRITSSAEETSCAEFWIGEVECCGKEWTFAVIGEGPDPVTSYVFHCHEAAERARRGMFTALGNAVGVMVLPPEE